MNEYNRDNRNDRENNHRLIRLIGLLRSTPPRDPQKVKQNRAKYLAQVDALIGMNDHPSPTNKNYQYQPKEKTNVNILKPKFALTALFIIAALSVFLFGGTGLTVYAAQSALPGDALYPVKTGLEQTRLSLTSSADLVAQLHLSLAQKRLDEIEGLIKEGRYDQVGTTAAEFERQIQLAVEALKQLSTENPARAGELTAQMMTELSTYTRALTGMLASLPDEVKVEVEQAIVGSESAGLWDANAKVVEFTGEISAMTTDSLTVMGRQVVIAANTEINGSFGLGDMVKVHAQVGADGVLTALEIEAADLLGNTNDNQNANTNDNENANTNLNENGNENEALNENSNLNENENENENDDEEEFEFKGTVQTILPDMWVIGGITVAVSPTTVIRGTIAVGDSVEVYTTSLPDGTVQALVIKLEDGSSSSDGEDQGGSIGSDDQSNDNESEHDDSGNSNEHDGGSNDNSGGGGENENEHDD